MDTTLALIGSALIASITAWITARVSKKKEPEDRDTVDLSNVAAAQRTLATCLEQLDAALAEVRGYRDRMRRLEDEVVKLGGNPAKLGPFVDPAVGPI